ncbi:Membrane carboxypeptidase/penicillin-binding protein [Cupriavidus gilardii J11]|uniref:Membrane carboxypeptidase/penicillin-binding protein n=1 Tax=Cupriavidus gilardii J11 TaxID=936133 RepID=A0A562BM38_9BURK|nr:transglycosylase domain-containing protein [Cupriavidus gilardii]TWG86274.1 Membrane carboxypeptidase/penicillin-binding protein [Cupriavidus gilardii J11]
MKRLWSQFLGLFVVALAVCALLAALAVVVASRQLPPLDAIASFRHAPGFVPLRQMPPALTQAVVAIEDERFYLHDGIDYIGVVRAGIANLSDELSQGASTITMQVARNFFLSREKTYTRKLYEALLAYRIESAFSKDEILELYMNKVYLGEGAYGFAQAARIYFDKPLGALTLAECAMLAGLPKAPSANNPVVNPRRARQRQAYILQRMLELGRIDQGQYDAALLEPLRLR